MAKKNKTIGWTLDTFFDGSGDFICQWVDENHYIEHCPEKAKTKVNKCMGEESTFSQCKDLMISDKLAKRFLVAWEARRRLLRGDRQ